MLLLQADALSLAAAAAFHLALLWAHSTALPWGWLATQWAALAPLLSLALVGQAV